nr:unnamed protein product [Callosobruchus chinensis]
MSFSLNMYNHPPKDTFIELSVLESIVNERLQLYCILEKATVKKRGWQGHWEESILQQMRQLKMENYINLLQDSNIFLDKDYTCWRDEVAHWLLLLYNSTSDELSELFIKRETEWLALRYRNAPAEDRYCFLKANHFDYPEVCIIPTVIVKWLPNKYLDIVQMKGSETDTSKCTLAEVISVSYQTLTTDMKMISRAPFSYTLFCELQFFLIMIMPPISLFRDVNRLESI